MVVVPTSNHVELHYGYTGVDYLSWLLTIIGVIGLAFLFKSRCGWSPVNCLDDPSRSQRPDRWSSVIAAAAGPSIPWCTPSVRRPLAAPTRRRPASTSRPSDLPPPDGPPSPDERVAPRVGSGAGGRAARARPPPTPIGRRPSIPRCSPRSNRSSRRRSRPTRIDRVEAVDHLEPSTDLAGSESTDPEDD